MHTYIDKCIRMIATCMHCTHTYIQYIHSFILPSFLPSFHVPGDRVSLPPEHREHFSEKLLLMNPSCIVNDYAQVQGDVLRFRGDNVLTCIHTYPIDNLFNKF